MTPTYTILVDGAEPSGSHSLGTVYQLWLHSSLSPTLVPHVDDIIDQLGRPLHPFEQDWLDLLTILYVADQICRRGSNEQWSRHITVYIPLRMPSIFTPLCPRLVETFGRMTHDNLSIEISTRSEGATSKYPRNNAQDNFDAIALLSGGLDSAFGAIDLYARNYQPCLVSARSSSHITKAQNTITRMITDHFNGIGHTTGFKIDVKANHPVSPLPNSNAREYSQRSRTLMYAGIAAVIASARNIDSITIAENGVMAINCPLTAGRIGGLSTHTAHPDVLAMMSRLFTELFQTSIAIENPLIHHSKTDVMNSLDTAGFSNVIQHTHSCWVARTPYHCGICVPCLVRRFSAEAAGTTDVSYRVDALSDFDINDDANYANLKDYLFFASSVQHLTDEELLFQFVELNVEGGHSAYSPLLELHRRWANDVLEVAKQYPALSTILG